MAHYAFLDENNIVTEVIVGCEENELVEGITNWENFYGEFRGQKCLRTSYNTFAGKHIYGGTPFRKNYAGIGYKYDENKDAFIPPCPHIGWILNDDECQWYPPIQYPSDGKGYDWNDVTMSWEEIK